MPPTKADYLLSALIFGVAGLAILFGQPFIGLAFIAAWLITFGFRRR
jgi:hypothetical protein